MTHDCHSFGKDPIHVPESLKLKGISCGIKKKHRGLFTHLAGETNPRFDDELHSGLTKPVGQRVPFIPAQDYPEVTHGNILAIDLIGGGPADFIGREMSHDLVAVK